MSGFLCAACFAACSAARFAGGKHKPWVQSFPVPGGEIVFNHLTGALKLDLGVLEMCGWEMVGYTFQAGDADR